MIGKLRPSERLTTVPRYGRGRAVVSPIATHRLGSNEVPDCDDGLQWPAAQAAQTVHRYPDLHGEPLIEALSLRFGLSQTDIAVGAGSIVLLDQLIRAFCDADDEILSFWRSYEAYPILAGISGVRLVTVPFGPDGQPDEDGLIEAISGSTRVVLLCNPNNPTGVTLSEQRIDAFLARIPPHLLVVLDEAYIEFASSPAEALFSPKRRLSIHPNLAILRTFSKVWGLAGARVGYCMANAPIIDALRTVAAPFPLSGMALAMAKAALARPDVVAARIARNASERGRLMKGLRTLGFPVLESQANFVWLPLGARASSFTEYLDRERIAVRCFDGEGVRITVGSPDDTTAVLGTAARFLTGGL